MKRYRVLLVDPPWHYRDKAIPGQRGVCFKYPLLTTKRLKELPMAKLGRPDSLLFLWATMPLLPDALEVVDAWGYKYSTVPFVWVKNTQAGEPKLGMGNWSRANAELVLLGKRGVVERTSKSVSQIVIHPAMPRTQKPEEVRERIDRLIAPKGRDRIEVFSTKEKVKRWVTTGFEADGLDIRELLEVANDCDS